MYFGVLLSLVSTSLFAGLYYYVGWLQPLSGEQIYGWRMLFTLPCITVFLLATRQLYAVRHIAERVRAQPSLFLGLLLSAALLALQQWLFLWAPINGRALQVSLGYFLMPLTMVVVGRLLYGERLSFLQTAAALCAAIGVLHEVARAGGFAWEALAVAIGFPAYFVLRKRLRTNDLGGLWFDVALTVPCAVGLALAYAGALQPFAHSPRLYLLIPLMAVISASAYLCYSTAHRLLPFSLFGLLGYVEPILMLFVSILIGERIGADEWWTYAPIWGGVALLALDGGLRLRAPLTPSPVEKQLSGL